MPEIPAARSALRMVRYLASRQGPIAASAIARDLGLPRSSTYQLLAVLMDEGYAVHYPEDRTYGLSTLVAEIGGSALRSERLARLARPLLETVVGRSPAPVVAHLSVLSGAEVTYAARVQGFRAPTTVSAVGVRLPAHLTATGRALLALLSHDQVRALYPSRDRLVRRAASGPATLAELDRILEDTRRRGWAVESGEITEDYASVAAAAVDRNGYPTAAIGLTYRDDPAVDADALGRATTAAAAALTARLAGQR